MPLHPRLHMFPLIVKCTANQALTILYHVLCFYLSPANASTLLSHLQKVGSIDPHVAFTLLRSCAGFCKFAYVARTTPPSMATATFEHFDRLIHECFSECTGVNNPGFKLN